MEESLLIKLIEAAKEKNFGYIGESLENIKEAKQFHPLVHWASIYGLTYKNPDVRDLAGTILEKAPISEHAFENIRDSVAEAMIQEAESPYAKDRFAFALAAHGPGNYRPEVMIVLENALADKEVSAIAEGYLKKLR